MNEFFFISTYDKVSADILASLINIHPDIYLISDKNSALLPQNSEISLDQFIKTHTSSSHQFSGNIQNFPAFELQYRILKEKTEQPFQKVQILLSPILRIRFLMYSWLKTDLTPTQLVNALEQQIFKNNALLNRYNISKFYAHVLNTMLISAKSSAQPEENMKKFSSPLSKLFFFALATVMTFDTADLPTTGKTFRLEALLSDKSEVEKLISYLTKDKASKVPDFEEQYKAKLQEIFNLLSELPLNTWESWQADLLQTYLNKRLETIYGSAIDKPLVHFYNTLGYSFAVPTEVKYSKLLSIQLNSNRPAQLMAYFDNIEETADNPQDIEVLVNIDVDNAPMKTLIESEIPKRKFTLKYTQSPRPTSFFDLWKPLNKLLTITDPEAYFLLNISDEMFFTTQGWDTILKKYVGFFPDHIFRLRASRNKFRSYFDRWECNFSQDSIPFTTQKWINIVGDWNPCFGPDSFQQLTSFYLSKESAFSNENYLREIPIIDIQFSGDIPSLGLDAAKSWKMFSDSIKALQICQSYKMQLEARRRAILLKANIYIDERQLVSPEIVDLKEQKKIAILVQGKTITTMSYKLNWLSINLANQWRKLFFYHYFGGGFNMEVKPHVSFLHYLVCKHEFALKIAKFISKYTRSNKGQISSQMDVNDSLKQTNLN
jgi:hypothetical protein